MNNNSNNHLVVMAGGVGSRFWPMSTPKRPKQFIDVLGVGKTLLQLTRERFRDLVPRENIWVVTGEDYLSIVKEQLPDLPETNILCEPCRRNTAPCIAYVSWRIKKTDPRANIVVTPSDHIVADTIEFQRVVKEAMAFTADSDAIVTLGIKPTRPETGYGYIEADLSSASLLSKSIYRVDSFREKPDLETARRYVAKNSYYWNAGIFVWNVRTIVNAFRMHQPSMAAVFDGLLPRLATPDEPALIKERFPLLENISVDYAIMERAEEIFVLPSDFGWSDLGTWGSLHTHIHHDLYGNAVVASDFHLVETSGCMIHVPQEKKVVIQGLEGFIVAESDSHLLICRLSEEQRIKQFI